MMFLWSLLGLLVLGALALQGYSRLAPVDAARWHVPPEVRGEAPVIATGMNWSRAAVLRPEPPVEALALLDAVIKTTPRTTVVAGDVASGMITYQTRSAFWGFPDFTTVEATATDGGTRLALHGRARMGRSDLGVNAARINGWLAALP